MTPLWTSAAIAAATGGRATRDFAAGGLSIDTRSLAPGDLFVALTDKRDGHDFVADALAKGAAGALVSRMPDGVAADAPLIVVPDVLAALRDMAAARRAASGAWIVAITGSVGKTTTKEMLRSALAAYGPVHAAEKSFNNHWGVPLTLARCPVAAGFAVIEIGMNHPGEIAPLSRLAAPDVAIVTIVAAAHLEAFESLDGIAREKASIFEGLRGGVAIWNGDLPQSGILAEAAEAADTSVAGSVDFGQGAGRLVRLLGVAPADGGLDFAVTSEGGDWRGHLAAPGAHLAMNATAVVATLRALGLDPAPGLAALAAWRPPEGRGTTERIAGPGGGFTLIDEAYNANPTSMAAALAVLAGTAPDPGGRRIAMLGDMLELGRTEAALHAALADLPAMAAVDRVHCAGPRMRGLWQALPEGRRGIWTELAEDLAARAGEIAGPGDVVMVKGSLGSRVGLVVTALRRASSRATANEG